MPRRNPPAGCPAILGRRQSHSLGETRTERAQADVADLHAAAGERHLIGFQQPPGAFHPQDSDELVRRFAEGAGEEALEVEGDKQASRAASSSRI
jgi:hypothetical protein